MEVVVVVDRDVVDRYSPLSSRLTALAFDSTRVNSFL